MYVSDFMEAFVQGKLGKKRVCGSWRVTDYPDGSQELRYYPTEDGEKMTDGYGVIVYETLAYKMADGGTIYNANRLEYIGTTMAWGRRIRNWGQTQDQQMMERYGAVGIPFTIFRELNESVSNFKFVHKPIAEKVIVGRKTWNYEKHDYEMVPTPTHFIGAALFDIGDNHFLFDVDRNELPYGIMNPFVVKLPRSATTVEDAYNSLVPDEVRNATSPVYRQGEYYFVYYGEESPITEELSPEDRETLKYVPSRFGFGLEKVKSSYMDDVRERDLVTKEAKEYQAAYDKYQAAYDRYKAVNPSSGKIEGDGSGSHEASLSIRHNGNIYVSGKVTHSRREHHELILEGWYTVHKNLAIMSLTIRGEVD